MGKVDSAQSSLPSIPNSQFHSGSPGSCGPMGRGASPVNAPNAHIRDGEANNGFLPMTKTASPVKGSNESLKFDVRNAQMPQPPATMQPGAASVPVNPFRSGNGVTGPALNIPDSALKMPKGK